MHKSNRCFVLELEWAVFSYKLPLKSKKVTQKRKKLHEIRKVARRTKSCSKSEKLLKRCRATYGQPYVWVAVETLFVIPHSPPLLLSYRKLTMGRISDAYVGYDKLLGVNQPEKNCVLPRVSLK